MWIAYCLNKVQTKKMLTIIVALPLNLGLDLASLQQFNEFVDVDLLCQ